MARVHWQGRWNNKSISLSECMPLYRHILEALMELEYTVSFQWANYQSITRVRADLNGALDVFLPKRITDEGELFPRLVESICTR